MSFIFVLPLYNRECPALLRVEVEVFMWQKQRLPTGCVCQGAMRLRICYGLVTKLCPILCHLMGGSPPGSSVHVISHQAPLSMWFPSQNTRVSCHFLLQGTFPTQGFNLYLLLGRWILYHWTTWDARVKITFPNCCRGHEEKRNGEKTGWEQFQAIRNIVALTATI